MAKVTLDQIGLVVAIEEPVTRQHDLVRTIRLAITEEDYKDGNLVHLKVPRNQLATAIRTLVNLQMGRARISLPKGAEILPNRIALEDLVAMASHAPTKSRPTRPGTRTGKTKRSSRSSKRSSSTRKSTGSARSRGS